MCGSVQGLPVPPMAAEGNRADEMQACGRRRRWQELLCQAAGLPLLSAEGKVGEWGQRTGGLFASAVLR